jgi:predicted O-methyltransferase YrrM
MHEPDFFKSYIIYNEYKTVVEIGVDSGQSALRMCLGVSLTNGKYYGYDCFEPYRAYGPAGNERTEEYVRTLLKRHDVDENRYKLTKINSHSPEFIDVLKNDTSSNIDFAFIDGDHSYDGITKDFLNVYPLLSEKGSIAFHDTYSHTGPRKFVIDLYTKYNDGTYDIINLPWYDGPEDNRFNQGLTILVKRFYPLSKKGLINNCHETATNSGLTDEMVYNEELDWYKKQISNRN